MVPFSFLWKNITNEWLVSKLACLLFAISALIILAVTVAALTVAPESELTPASRSTWAALGVFGAVGIFFLWGGMWKFWSSCDSSSRWKRRLSFAVLLIGLWYGAIVYFFVVHLPTAIRSDFGRRTV